MLHGPLLDIDDGQTRMQLLLNFCVARQGSFSREEADRLQQWASEAVFYYEMLSLVLSGDLLVDYREGDIPYFYQPSPEEAGRLRFLRDALQDAGEPDDDEPEYGNSDSGGDGCLLA